MQDFYKVESPTLADPEEGPRGMGAPLNLAQAGSLWRQSASGGATSYGERSERATKNESLHESH